MAQGSVPEGSRGGEAMATLEEAICSTQAWLEQVGSTLPCTSLIEEALLDRSNGRKAAAALVALAGLDEADYPPLDGLKDALKKVCVCVCSNSLEEELSSTTTKASFPNFSTKTFAT